MSNKLANIFILTFLCTFAFTASQAATFFSTNSTQQPNKLERNLYWVKHTCQCRFCKLQGANLSNFKPGSQSKTVNPLYKNNPFVDKSKRSVSDAGWMGCDFTAADFSNANLTQANFRVTLRGYMTPISKADFSYANFSNAQLNKAILYGAIFAEAKFNKANLQSADLSLANFKKADFSGADLRHAVSTMDAMHGWGANFRYCNFTAADLRHATLYGDFAHSNFSHAKLQGAELDTSPQAVATALERDIYSDKPWQGVDFSYANLQGATLRSNSKLISLLKTGAILCHTILPNGKSSDRDCK